MERLEQVGDIIVPLYEAKAVVTSVTPYKGKYPEFFSHTINYRYIASGVCSGMSVNRRKV